MKAGYYFIGDPKIFIKKFSIDNITKELIINIKNNNIYKIETENFVIFKTKIGPGCFRSYSASIHLSDSGLMGCIFLEKNIDLYEELKEFGTIQKFDKSFDVSVNNGQMHFGNLIIDTDPSIDSNDFEDTYAD